MLIIYIKNKFFSDAQSIIFLKTFLMTIKPSMDNTNNIENSKKDKKDHPNFRNVKI